MYHRFTQHETSCRHFSCFTIAFCCLSFTALHPNNLLPFHCERDSFSVEEETNDAPKAPLIANAEPEAESLGLENKVDNHLCDSQNLWLAF